MATIQTKPVTHTLGEGSEQVEYSVSYFEADVGVDIMFDVLAPLIGEPAASMQMGLDVAVKALLKRASSKEVKSLISVCMKYVGEVRDGGVVAPIGKSWNQHFAGRIDEMFELVFRQLEQNYGNTIKKAVALWQELDIQGIAEELNEELAASEKG